MITVQCSILCSQLNNKPRVVVTTVADRCHATSCATRVLYSTAHVSLARARARLCTIYSTAHVSLARARARLCTI